MKKVIAKIIYYTINLALIISLLYVVIIDTCIKCYKMYGLIGVFAGFGLGMIILIGILGIIFLIAWSADNKK